MDRFTPRAISLSPARSALTSSQSSHQQELLSPARRALTFFLLFLPILLSAANLSQRVDLAPASHDETSLNSAGFGWQSAPGTLRLPVKTINLLLPPGAELQSWTAGLGSTVSLAGAAPQINPAFSDGERSLNSPRRDNSSQRCIYLGLRNWGDLRFASFRVLPALWDEATERWLWSRDISLSVEFTASEKAVAVVPPSFRQLDKRASFFANASDLDKWYSASGSKFYDILYVGTPASYAAISALEAFRNSQGFITSFANIATILAETAGSNPADKLRNYLISEYLAHPFTYLVLLGDYDVVPVAMLTPEPDGYETVPSDFFYGDLSSIIDTDGDLLLGEYSSAEGNQDWGVDFTPEVFVGRFSTNSATELEAIAARVVAFEQSEAAWKNNALLPAAFLNYQNEPETGFLQTDGADFMEYVKASVLSGMNCSTMYEQTGVVLSHPSDLALDYDLLKNLLSSQSYGLLNWSAHGSSTSSSRKVWINDDNANLLPDSWEMDWMNLVNRQSFNGLVNQDGMVIFMASCYNGMIDHTGLSLAEHALVKKGVAVFGATRTGWYKIGWIDPGWGGLSSYNYHVLENYVPHQMSVGAAAAWTNLLHTQYYLFGDPVDSGGIIWPELQNVYTYLLYGDPVVGHTAAQTAPEGEILVWEPMGNDAFRVINALHTSGRWNVVHTDKLIPDYDYIDRFDAVFALFGRGDTAYILNPASLEYNLLNSYLENGGKLYLEGMVGWDPMDTFWGKFGTHAPLDMSARIDAVGFNGSGIDYVWQYDQTDTYTDALLPFSASAIPIFHTVNVDYPQANIGIWNSDGQYRSIASSFSLGDILPGNPGIDELIQVICDTLDVGESAVVANDDPTTPAAMAGLKAWPNPFGGSVNISLELKYAAPVRMEVFNLRGQKLRTLNLPVAKGIRALSWDGRDASGTTCPTGIYILRATASGQPQTLKVLKIK